MTTFLPRDPNPLLRIGGVLYLMIIALGLFGELVARGTLVVAGNAAATAANVVAAESLWRWGIAGDILAHILDVPLLLILFGLYAPVSVPLAVLGALFVLVQTTVLVTVKLAGLAALSFLGQAAALQAFDAGQVQALAVIAIRSDVQGLGIGLVFFGCALLVNGGLIVRSGYVPKAFGFLLQIAGACYLVNSFAMLLSPRLHAAISPAVLVPCLVAELAFACWLLFKGVGKAAWEQRLLHAPSA